ncbi:hypothetical protein GCM10028832_09860 [Streptomyces sparsus]
MRERARAHRRGRDACARFRQRCAWEAPGTSRQGHRPRLPDGWGDGQADGPSGLRSEYPQVPRRDVRTLRRPAPLLGASLHTCWEPEDHWENAPPRRICSSWRPSERARAGRTPPTTGQRAPASGDLTRR